MSTFATVVWVDLRPSGPIAAVAAGLDRLGNRDGDADPGGGRIWIDVETDRVRLTTSLRFGVDLVDGIRALVTSADWARVVVAEDHDEFGAAWTVLSVEAGTTRVVHRRYVLNADPGDRRDVRRALRDFATDGVVHDPRADDVAGPDAAREAAAVFGVQPGPVMAAEAASDNAFESLGVVGGPFPWREPMGLPWPGPDAGQRFAPRR